MPKRAGKGKDNGGLYLETSLIKMSPTDGRPSLCLLSVGSGVEVGGSCGAVRHLYWVGCRLVQSEGRFCYCAQVGAGESLGNTK